MMKTAVRGVEIILLAAGLLFAAGGCVHRTVEKEVPFVQAFDGADGSLEIGGPYVGAEFHHSRPLPTRISFFDPVANSIDLSRDYWKRDRSHPLTITATVNDTTDTLGSSPFAYEWTPYFARFHGTLAGLPVTVTYDFCDSLPAMVVGMKLHNDGSTSRAVNLTFDLNAVLRTCQTYTWRDKVSGEVSPDGQVILLRYPNEDTDSAAVFVANAGLPALAWSVGNVAEMSRSLTVRNPVSPHLSLSYNEELSPGGEMDLTWLIGSTRFDRVQKTIDHVKSSWRDQVDRYRRHAERYALSQSDFDVDDSSLELTARWSKAMLYSDRHYIDGHLVPMPCPAEYNFYFTHDVLLTDLGAVNFDLERVRNDLDFLGSLSGPDSVLAHAYYWRDDGYKTEFAGSDNWNHLWFIQVCASYLRHSSDSTTVARLFPIAEKSLHLILTNLGKDGLMYGERPDWWDIGKVYGARTYLTVLTIRALQDYVYLADRLGRTEAIPPAPFVQVRRMKKQLADELWSDASGYLLNRNGPETDRHYYIGSLLAPVFGALDKEKSGTLVETAAAELLDDRLGIRNAMPDDFDSLAAEYHFLPGEVGGPYLYMNGAVWPHGTAWYALAQLAIGRSDDALTTLKNYLTLEGIRNSPNGQPSFFEFRDANPDSPAYGHIEKPTFLWAGGWYLYTLYHIAGVREEPWNLRLDANLPDSLGNVAYDLTVGGYPCAVEWRGKGKTFKSIQWGIRHRNVPSAVVFGTPEHIVLERGQPREPYLESATATVRDVSYDLAEMVLRVVVTGLDNQPLDISVVGPSAAVKATLRNRPVKIETTPIPDGPAVRTTLHGVCNGGVSEVLFHF